MGNQRFSIAPAKAARDASLPDTVYRTLALLGVYGDENGWCWPSLATIAKDRDKSPQAISKHIQALKERGYLRIHQRFSDNGAQTSNKYQILFDYPPSTSEVEAPSTPEIEAPSTSEVELTTHNNDPTNIPTIKDKAVKPPAPKKPAKKRDERLDHPAMKAYNEIARYWPPFAVREAVCQVEDAERWADIVKDWIGKGWNPRNISGMLDIYKNGDRQNGHRPTQARTIADAIRERQEAR